MFGRLVRVGFSEVSQSSASRGECTILRDNWVSRALKDLQMDCLVKQEVANESHCRSGLARAAALVAVQPRIPDKFPHGDSAQPPASTVPILIGETSAQVIVDLVVWTYIRSETPVISVE